MELIVIIKFNNYHLSIAADVFYDHIIHPFKMGCGLKTYGRACEPFPMNSVSITVSYLLTRHLMLEYHSRITLD